MSKTFPEYPTVKYLGKTADGKDVFMIGNSMREYTADDFGYDLLRYTLFRLDSLIRYKREQIALDNIK